MTKIKEIKPESYKVEIQNSDTETTHEVALEDSYYLDLTNKKISKEELLKKSFEFLLERESNQSILKKFNLREISRYFPEFEQEMRKKF